MNHNRIVDLRTTPDQQDCNILSKVTKEHPHTSARPIRKTMDYFEHLSENQNSGLKRQLQGKVESPAKYARTTGSYRKGLFKNYTCDSQRIKHTYLMRGRG